MDVVGRAAVLLLGVRGASAADPSSDGRVDLGPVLRVYDSIEHDVLPISDFDGAVRFLVRHGFLTVRGGSVLELTAAGFAASAGTSAAATSADAVGIVRARLDGLDPGDADAAPAVDPRAYHEAVSHHVARPRSRAGAPRPRAGEPAAPTPPHAPEPTRAASRASTAAKVGGVVAAAVALGVIGLPSAPVVLLASGAGSAVVLADAASRRVAGAAARVGAAGRAGYRLQVPAERVAVGRSFQLRLLPPTRRVWAPGLLCIADDHVRFIAAKERHADRDWEEASSRLESTTIGVGSRVATVVRVHGTDGAVTAQFVVQGRFSP